MKKKNGMVSNLFVVGIILTFLYVVVKLVSVGGRDNKVDAWVLTKHAVEQKLKSPSTAKFPSYGGKDVKFTEYDDTCIITSYVDAQNSFGAKVRSSFVATLKKNSNGDYIVESVYIN